MLALLFHLALEFGLIHSVIHIIIYSNLLCDLLLGVAVFFWEASCGLFQGM